MGKYVTQTLPLASNLTFRLQQDVAIDRIFTIHSISNKLQGNFCLICIEITMAYLSHFQTLKGVPIAKF